MSDGAQHDVHETHGTSLLRDPTEDQLRAAHVLASTDSLLIEELPEDEDDAFAAPICP